MFFSPQFRMNAFNSGPRGMDFIRSMSLKLTGSKPEIPDATQNTFIEYAPHRSHLPKTYSKPPAWSRSSSEVHDGFLQQVG